MDSKTFEQKIKKMIEEVNALKTAKRGGVDSLTTITKSITFTITIDTSQPGGIGDRKLLTFDVEDVNFFIFSVSTDPSVTTNEMEVFSIPSYINDKYCTILDISYFGDWSVGDIITKTVKIYVTATCDFDMTIGDVPS